MNSTQPRPAIFLDRDGVLNVDTGYVYTWRDWRWLKNVPLALKILQNAGFKLVIVSNQSGIARGFYDKADVIRLQAQINFELAKNDTRIDAFYFCEHHPDYSGPCGCRKPQPGLIFRAAKELNLDLQSSWLIGDRASDIRAALAAGIKPILVQTGPETPPDNEIPASVPILPDLFCCANYIKSHQE